MDWMNTAPLDRAETVGPHKTGAARNRCSPAAA